MNVKQTLDLHKILKVLKDPEIFDRISEDGPTSDTWMPSMDEAIFLSDEEGIGVMIYHWVNSVTLECHVQVLAEHRSQAYEFGQKALEWAWQNTKATKIVAQIPEIYPSVIKFAYKNGFSFEGVNKLSHRKNGELHDQYYLGLIKPREV
jgi:RimJ/RimL family protein N-acetyltransferase